MKSIIQRLINLFRKDNQETEKEFTMSVEEFAHVGDRYEYKVKARNRDEAIKKLVCYFYSNRAEYVGQVESSHGIVTRPLKSEFNVEGMPTWLAKKISGVKREGDYDYEKMLHDYCEKNKIEIEQR